MRDNSYRAAIGPRSLRALPTAFERNWRPVMIYCRQRLFANPSPVLTGITPQVPGAGLAQPGTAAQI
jgi:hypothetical protein